MVVEPEHLAGRTLVDLDLQAQVAVHGKRRHRCAAAGTIHAVRRVFAPHGRIVAARFSL
jgi:hypothetical protein